MPSLELAAGSLRVTFPDSYGVEPARPAAAARQRQPPGASARTKPIGPTDEVSAALLAAFAEQNLELVEPFALVPATPAGPSLRRGLRPSQPGKVRLALDLAPGEDAVVLLEQDGFFSWQMPTGHDAAPTTSRRRGGPPPTAQIRGGSLNRVARFEIDVRPVAPARPSARTRAVRGPFGDFVIGRLTAYVLKFVSGIVPGAVMSFLERDNRPGLVLMTGNDVTSWPLVDNLTQVTLPDTRPAKILLFVHGTFSTTVGSYGVLTSTAQGQELLGAARDSYDAIISFDHPTLSRDPLENATDLLARLKAQHLAFTPTIDIVSYSRGGLVARSFIEYLLPSSTWRANIGKVVFVGATNAGTLLAEPDNWKAFVDLHTNLAAGAARAIGFVTGAAPAAAVVAGLVKGIGAFVKYLVSTSVADRRIPGLAAMEPDGPFITEINRTQPGQPVAGTPWYVVSSDFEVKLFDDRHEPPELPRQLVAMLADGLVDRLMGAKNDLVVDTASMGSVDLPSGGGFIKDSLSFGTNGVVYHLNYFIQPKVCRALMDWLQVGGPPRSVEPGTVVAPALPRRVSRSVVAVRSDDKVAAVRKAIGGAKYVVLTSDHLGGTLHHAFESRSLKGQLMGKSARASVGDFLDLQKDTASTAVEAGGWVDANFKLGQPRGGTRSRGVVVDGGSLISVIDEVTPDALTDIAPARRAARRTKAQTTARTARPTAARTPARGGDGARVRSPRPSRGAGRTRTTVEVNVAADMPTRVIVGETFAVSCRLSREQLEAVAGRVNAAGGVLVDPFRDLIVQIVPKRNTEILGEDRADVPLPDPGDISPVFFDVRATDPGKFEVWVILRQGPAPLVTLTLTAEASTASTARATRGTGRVTAEARVGPSPVTKVDGVQWFRIFETQQGAETVYLYDVQAEGLGILQTFQSPPLRNRQEYVDGLYTSIEQRWLSSGGDQVAFQQELRAFGGQMFDQLFPAELQGLLWDNRRKLRQLMVVSEECFIPWELVHLKQRGKPLPKDTLFLGQFGMVRWLHGTFPKPLQFRTRRGKVRSLCPEYVNPDWALPQVAQEAEFVADRLGAVPVKATQLVVQDLVAGGGFDLLHFAGHGVASGGDMSAAKILLSGRVEGGQYVEESISATTVEQTANLADEKGNGPLVVLNACQVGRVSHQLSSLGGFAEAFLRGGAGGFVSSLWSVGDEPARAFVETLYRKLLAGQTISEAAVAARAAARLQGDATWLAYVVYAHPAATLQPPKK
jgi:hypothetical protein